MFSFVAMSHHACLVFTETLIIGEVEQPKLDRAGTQHPDSSMFYTVTAKSRLALNEPAHSIYTLMA